MQSIFSLHPTRTLYNLASLFLTYTLYDLSPPFDTYPCDQFLRQEQDGRHNAGDLR